MRLCIIALLAAGCPGGGGGYNPLPGTQTGVCDEFGSGFVEASDSTLSITQLLVDGLAILPGFGATTACVPAQGYGGGWAFSDSMGPFGRITTYATTDGPQQVSATNLVIDFFGHEPPVYFTGQDFNSSSTYTVNQLDPFSVSFLGDATDADGHTLVLQYQATITP